MRFAVGADEAGSWRRDEELVVPDIRFVLVKRMPDSR